MNHTRVSGLKAPNVIARADGPGMRCHNFSPGLKGRPNRCRKSGITDVPPLQGGGNFRAPVYPGLHPGLQHCGLSARLRAATSESEKATLQNAVTATDQQIDQLVYELYGLTEEEKNLVEGAQ